MTITPNKKGKRTNKLLIVIIALVLLEYSSYSQIKVHLKKPNNKSHFGKLCDLSNAHLFLVIRDSICTVPLIDSSIHYLSSDIIQLVRHSPDSTKAVIKSNSIEYEFPLSIDYLSLNEIYLYIIKYKRHYYCYYWSPYSQWQTTYTPFISVTKIAGSKKIVIQKK